ncbi:MAG TPA: GNAT family N-acetyltransferase [Nitrolancea sp.]|nr:GNAT family N-acetyltransferase [Nitrolancea sp.]
MPLPRSIDTSENRCKGEKSEIVELCNRAFIQDFGELFDLVANAVAPMHVQARIDGRLISHAMWSERTLHFADGTTLTAVYVDAVATDPAFQNRGFGSIVIRRLNAAIQGFALGCLATNRPSFYTRAGWERWTGSKGVKTESGVRLTPDETVMIFRTAHSPKLDTNCQLVIENRRGDPW